MSLGLVDADAVWLIHTAGPLADSVQCCSVCGQILVDERNTTWRQAGLDRRYDVGSKVARLADVVTAPYPIPPGRRLPSGHVLCTSVPKDHR